MSGGTEPVRELLERSIFRSCVIFFMNFHETVPLRFLEESCISEIGGVVQLEREVLKNQEMLKPETEAKALARRAWSELLQADVDDSARKTSEEMKSMNMKRTFMVRCCFLVFTALEFPLR